jgi:outer membrane immunogenic protein
MSHSAVINRRAVIRCEGVPMRKLVLGSAMSLAMVAGASSADLYTKAPAPAPPPVWSWTGCYVGAGGGYGMFDISSQQIVTATGAAINPSLDQGGRGWFGTGQFGCDYQISSSWVVGAFADGDFSDIHGNFTGQGFGVGNVSNNLKLSSSWAAGGRIGYLVNPAILTYVSGGWTQARFDQVNYLLVTGVPTGVSLPAATYNGGFVGGGVEYNLGWFPGMFWKTEYRVASYSTQTLAEFLTATGVPTGAASVNHPYVQSVRSELVLRFNMGGPRY